MTEIIRVPALAWHECQESDTIRDRTKRLSPRGSQIGVSMEELPPGCNTGVAHYHTKEEEHLFVLGGAMEVRRGKEWFPVAAGDYLCFPAGDPREHKFRNRHDEPCQYVMFGTRCEDDVVVYPDNEAVYVRQIDRVLRDAEHPNPHRDD